MNASLLLPKERERYRAQVANLLTRAYLGLGLQAVQDGLAATLRISPNVVAVNILPRVNPYSEQIPQEAGRRLPLGDRQRIDAVIDEMIGNHPARLAAAGVLAHVFQQTLPAQSASNRLVALLDIDLELAREVVRRVSPAAGTGPPAGDPLAELATSLRLAEAVSQRVQALKNVSVLSSLPDEAIQMMAARVETVRLKQDEAVVRQGDKGDALYITTEGSIRVEQDRRFVATLKAGDVVGEMALVTGARRNATVLVESPAATFLKLTETDFDWFSQHFPQFRRSIAQLAQSRLPTLLPGERNLIGEAVARVSRLSADEPGVGAILTRAYLGQLGREEVGAGLRSKHGIPLDIAEAAFSRVSSYPSLRAADRQLLDPIIQEAMDHSSAATLSEVVRPAVANVLAHVYRKTLDLVPAYQRLVALGVVQEYAHIDVRRAASPSLKS